jgi:hypothetical protein
LIERLFQFLSDLFGVAAFDLTTLHHEYEFAVFQQSDGGRRGLIAGEIAARSFSGFDVTTGKLVIASDSAVIGGVKLSGLVAWLAWLFVHIMFLIGFRNRFLVLFEWAWAYLTWQRGARLITGPWRGRDR